jgi:excisionase family DNA binding protein
MTPNQPLLTTVEVAEACKVDPNTVSRWAREGLIPFITLPGGRLRYRRADVDALLTPVMALPVEQAGVA